MPAEAAKLRARQRREREELVVAEAERLIAETGYASFVMESLADRIGVAKATLYLYFPTKGDLLAAVVSRVLAQFNEQLMAICHRDDISARGRLILVGRTISERHSAWAWIMHGTEVPDLKQVLARQAEFAESLEHTALSVADLIREGQRSGDFGMNVSPVAAAAAVIELMLAHTRFSALEWSSVQPSPVELLDVLVTGLLPRSTTS